MAGISVRLPLSVDVIDGPYGLHKELKDSVRQNLKMLLLTIPGERIMNPDFGVGLQKLLFENDTKDTRGRIHDRIRSQVAKYMPFIKVRDSILPDYGSVPPGQVNTLFIEIEYYIEPLSAEDILKISLSSIVIT
jgi:phage baseplate assembly protein W